jgi:hypothetical protein
MSKKIYFAGSIAGGRQDEDLYGRIIAKLGEYGKVLTEIVGHYPNLLILLRIAVCLAKKQQISII